MLDPNVPLSKQGVEPYTVLFLMVQDVESGQKSVQQTASMDGAVEIEPETMSMWEEPSGPRYIVIDERYNRVVCCGCCLCSDRLGSNVALEKCSLLLSTNWLNV